jgi:hypothetical protein
MPDGHEVVSIAFMHETTHRPPAGHVYVAPLKLMQSASIVHVLVQKPWPGGV